MPLHLVSNISDTIDLDSNAISRLKYSPRRRASRPNRVASPSGANRDVLGVARPGEDESDSLSGESYAPYGPRPDRRADQAQAEREDVALVKLAAAKLAIALREVHVLLRGDRGAWKSDALARCTAKGWIRLQGDAFGAQQTFRVTPEGYRAAGLRVPPFTV